MKSGFNFRTSGQAPYYGTGRGNIIRRRRIRLWRKPGGIHYAMRYAIFADIHSNLEAFQTVLKALKELAIDELICAGDIIGYGANPQACLELIKENQVKTIAGNHDFFAVNLSFAKRLNPSAKEAIFWTAKTINEEAKEFLRKLLFIYEDKNLICAHGTLDNPKDFNYLLGQSEALETFKLLRKNICFVAHTHFPLVFTLQNNKIDLSYLESVEIKPENKYICNVGSVGQSRDGNPKACFCVFDTKKRLVETKRISYNIKEAQDKIRKAGLPEILAARLDQGR